MGTSGVDGMYCGLVPHGGMFLWVGSAGVTPGVTAGVTPSWNVLVQRCILA